MTDGPDIAPIAADLRVVVGQLVRRYRQDRTVPQPQMGALGWLWRKGPKTTSQLAGFERVRPQSMAHTVAQMEEAGLVERTADPSDGRQQLVSLTDAGREAYDDMRVAGESWAREVIRERLTADEQQELARGIELLGRLVDD